MEFEIEPEVEEEEDYKKKRKKDHSDWLVYASIFFFLLAIILIIVYFASLQKKSVTPVEPAPVNVVPKEDTPPELPKTVSIVDESSNERPLAVMIDTNIGDAKHAGLQDSYVNYEIIVEGGLTRIMALYKDKDVSVIGPVRSARDYFIDYALEHDAVYAHFGWSPAAEDTINALKVNNINGMTDTAPYMRDRNLPSPHNVFTSTSRLRNYFDKKEYSSTSSSWKVFNYSASEVSINKNEAGEFIQRDGLESASKISIVYSNSENRSYSFDSGNKYYLRSKNGSAHIDRKTSNQLHYKNIIIMRVSNRTIDNAGRQELRTTGSGEGYFITNGYAAPIRWSKSSREAKTVYTYRDGSEIVLNDGNTFIQVVPTDSDVVIG